MWPYAIHGTCCRERVGCINIVQKVDILPGNKRIRLVANNKEMKPRRAEWMTVYAGFENERKQFPPPPTTSACPPPPPSPRAAQPPDLTYPSASQSEDSGGILKTPRRIPTSLFFSFIFHTRFPNSTQRQQQDHQQRT